VIALIFLQYIFWYLLVLPGGSKKSPAILFANELSSIVDFARKNLSSWVSSLALNSGGD